MRHALLVLALFSTFAPAQDLPSKLDAHMKGLEAGNSFSGSVLVARKGKVLLGKGYGMANHELGVPNRPGTKFRIGSVTKQFTAVSILQLQEQGKLAVEDSVCKWIENCPEAWKKVTIHHLLSHTSGIPNFTSFADYGATQALPATLTSIIDRFRSRPLVFEPMERWAYSNSNYILLGQVIEKASGKSYADFVSANIFEPVKLASTGYDDTRKIIKNRAAGYSRRLNSFVNSAYIDMSVPHAAGALYSTVEDLYRWDRALYTTTLLKKPSLDRMFTPVKSNYAYGWFVDQADNRKRIWHGGGINGFAAMLVRYPDDDATVIVLSNVETTNTMTIVKALTGLLFAEAGK